MIKNDFRLVGALVLAVVVYVCFWRLSLHPADLLVGPQDAGKNDISIQYVAFRGFLSRGLTDGGSALLWNEFSLGGTPWLGNPQTAMFYPPNWLYAVADSERMVSWLMVAHHWLAGLGTFLLCRRYGFHWPAALLAGIAYLAAPYYVAGTGEGHYNQGCLVAWIPWAFLLVERLRAGQRGGVIGTTIVLALAFFCGHIQECFYLVLLLTAFLSFDVVACLWRKTTADASPAPASRMQSAARIVLRWGAVGALLVGLVAVELVPMYVYSRNSVRVGGIALNELRPACLQPISLVQLFDPLALGGPVDYRGPGMFYWEAVCHFGIITSLFALVGAAACRRRYPAGRFVILWLAAFLFAFGDRTPWFPLLYHCVPGVSLFRAPSRALFFCSFFTAVLAGVGLDWLLALSARAKIRWRRGLLASAVVALCLGGAVWLWQSSGGAQQAALTPAGIPSWPEALGMLAVLRVLAWTLAGLGVMVLLTLSGRVLCYGAALAVVLGIGELTWHSGEVLRTIPQASIRRENPIVAAIQPRLGWDRILASQALVSDREARRAGLQKVQGYDPVPLGRIALYFAATAPRQDAAMCFAGFHELDLAAVNKPLLDALGVRYAGVAGTAGREPPGWRRWQSGRLPEEFVLRGQQPSDLTYTIYENTSVLPRAFVLGSAIPLGPPQDELEQLARLDPRQSLLVERDLLPPGPRQAFRPARIVEYTASRVTIEAELDAPGYLVLTDVFYPGWDAIVDGRPAPLVSANMAFRAVALEPGRHAVEFRYMPPGMKTGGFMTIVTMFALCIAATWRRKTRG
jgi:hypothetical protein